MSATYIFDACAHGLKWVRIATVQADNDADAFRKAMILLPSEHYESQLPLLRVRGGGVSVVADGQ
jgi:hypothetical protein